MSSTTSHVMLAANAEDLRILTKQFIPDNVAYNIFEMVKDAVSRQYDRIKLNDEPKFRDEPSVPDLQPAASESVETVRLIHEHKREDDKESNSYAHFEVNLKELIEKVKQKLRSELTNSNVKAIPQNNEKLSKILTAVNDGQGSNEPHYNLSDSNSDDVKFKPRDKEYHEKKAKYQISEQQHVIQPPKYIFDQSAPHEYKQKDAPIHKTPSNHRQVNKNINSKYIKKINQSQHVTIITKNPTPFKGFNMLQTNGSYDNNAITKQDEDYAEVETKPPKQKVVQQIPYIEVKNRQTQTKPKPKDKNFEDETINYNKRIKNSNADMKYINSVDKHFKQRLNNQRPKKESPITQQVIGNNRQKIQPYVDTEHVINKEDAIVEPPKVRFDIISHNENKNKIYKRQQEIESKRNYNRMSSPNKVVKLSIVAKKWSFDEPIPEEDWVADPFQT